VGRSLEGKVAIITGAADGIGRATAARLVEDGAAVVLTDINGEGCKEAAAAIVDAGGTAHATEHDVSIEEQWPGVIEAALGAFGGVHIVVNNAGIGGFADVEHETMEEYQRVIAVTQTGMWLGMKYGGPAVEHSGGGSIINISSVFGVSGGLGVNFSYHAAKGAVRLMTKNAALHWATRGVRVNSIHPGFIGTRGVLEFAATEAGRVMTDLTPMGRLGAPSEVAAAASFLASDDASFITGSELHVDGGYLAR
jgi:NAD(P)-dependent dehydrogenase (short-subunit alcohol dehydrogenase family)